MSASRLQVPATSRPTGLMAVARRLLVSWRRYRSEQALTALSFDMLKDIGFRSANDTGGTTRR